MTPERFLPSPVACDTLATLVARFGGRMNVLAEERTHRLGPPPSASEELRLFLSRSMQTETQGARFRACLVGGRVFGSGNVLSPDGTSIARDVSPDFGKPFSDHWLLSYRKIRPPVRLEGTTAVAATTLGNGYSHWLLEELPRLLSLQGQTFDRLLAHTDSAFGREALRVTGVEAKCLRTVKYAHFACDDLLIPSVPNDSGPSPEEVREVVAFTDRVSEGVAGRGERIYVTRNRARRRRVSNESELWVRLETLGFVKVELEELTWPEQIATFRQAKVVVGPHGAGFANLIFCEPGTRVIELFNREYVNGCYWRRAAAGGLEYRPIVARGERALACALEANRFDIEAEVARVVEAVEAG